MLKMLEQHVIEPPKTEEPATIAIAPVKDGSTELALIPKS